MSYQHWLKKISDLEEGASYLRKWGMIAVVIGVVTGLGALALIWLIDLLNHHLLGVIVGYAVPLPGGEGGRPGYVFHIGRPWVLPLVTAGAGLVGGLLVWKLAPEAAGIGTNAAIRAFHLNQKLRPRTSLLKLLTSALTIGGGLTSGREGPIAQIGAAAGASIADFLKLTARERNIALAAGLGAGIASVFKAPLAGAIIGAEIFYTEDFEVEALVPGLIASVIGYSIVGSVTGFQPVFSPPPEILGFDHPLSLVFFAALGIGCGLLARFLFAVYYRTERFFKRFPLWLAAALGGLCTGLIGLAVPSVIGTGYGWAQFAIAQQVDLLPPTTLFLAAFAEIISASLTLGSGNSGGIFGPSVVTGGLFGGAVGYGAHYFFPSVVDHPGNFAIVGMVAFFAAAAKAPISTIIMISEMTGGYGLLAPAMIAVVTAFIISGKGTIFPAQVRSRLDSPFHADEFAPIVLRRVKAADAMIHLPVYVKADVSVGEAITLMGDYGLASLPVVDSNRLTGRITLLASHRLSEAIRSTTPVREIMSPLTNVAFPDDDLFTILKRFAASDVGNLPVVSREKPDCPVGLITRSALWQAIEAAKEQHAGKETESTRVEKDRSLLH